MSPFLRTPRAASYAALSLCALAAFNCSHESVSDSAVALAGKSASVTMMMETYVHEDKRNTDAIIKRLNALMN